VHVAQLRYVVATLLGYTVPFSGSGDAKAARSLCATVCLSACERCGVVRAKAFTGPHVGGSGGDILVCRSCRPRFLISVINANGRIS
jgi:hypothetical protein